MRKYDVIRKKLGEYRLIENELRLRTKYLDDFKKILVNPLPSCEVHLKEIYSVIIKEMECEITKLHKRIIIIDKIMNCLTEVERNVIYYRYILKTEWIKIPEYVLYEQRTCQAIEHRALKKISEMNIDWDGDKLC